MDSIFKKWWFYAIIISVIVIISISIVFFVILLGDNYEEERLTTSSNGDGSREERQNNFEEDPIEEERDGLIGRRAYVALSRFEEAAARQAESERENGNAERIEPERIYLDDLLTVATIEIPRTGIHYPILERGTADGLELAVAVMWPNHAMDRINESGNVVIMGHNFRNDRFFSNNDRLQLGDRIYITDFRGRRVGYTIYLIFETTPEDTSYIIRDTEGETEITLSTCTNGSSRRLIIQARAE
ncbi:MAG: sortase [Oscillospiraceae bacterium]|nr:sortase [Oscillospiraceae bacterium]